MFEGIVISVKGVGLSKMITVRKVSYGVGVEKILPVNSPIIKKIDIIKRGNVRRAKLYYMREKVGKRSLDVMLDEQFEGIVEAGDEKEKASPDSSEKGSESVDAENAEKKPKKEGESDKSDGGETGAEEVADKTEVGGNAGEVAETEVKEKSDKEDKTEKKPKAAEKKEKSDKDSENEKK